MTRRLPSLKPIPDSESVHHMGYVAQVAAGAIASAHRSSGLNLQCLEIVRRTWRHSCVISSLLWKDASDANLLDRWCAVSVTVLDVPSQNPARPVSCGMR